METVVMKFGGTSVATPEKIVEVAKKAIAEKFGLTPATLTKYINELIEFLPLFES